jgi:3-oxoadipate enol-lactonase
MKTLRLVLIHGFTESPAMWDEIIAELDVPHVEICTPSIPGHGNHPSIPKELTAQSYCKKLLEQLPNDELPCIIVGHSMGGYLAATLVQLIPQRVKAIGFFHSKAGSDDAQKLEDRKRAIEAANQNKDLYLAGMLRNTLAECNVQRLQNELSLIIETAKREISYECISAAQQVMIERKDAINYLSKGHFSIYYFLGLEDKSIPYANMKTELDSLPNAVIHLVENTGHMGQLEYKTEAITWLRKICLS